MYTYLAVFGVGILFGLLSALLLLVLWSRFQKNLPEKGPTKEELKSLILDDDHAFEVENSK